MYLGTVRHSVDVTDEYKLLAIKDEEVALLLKYNRQYRHSIYFFIQAMEKYIRSKIFSKVNANLEYFRNRNKSHSLGNAIEFLIEIVSSDDNVRNQVKKQLNDFVLENIRFQQLHNNLRYPFYSHKYDSYLVAEYSEEDCIFIEKKLEALKKYLVQIDKLSAY